MATKILDSGGPYFANPLQSEPAVPETVAAPKPTFENPVDQIRLEEAFAAAARVDEALERAVSRKFKDDGEYKATNPLNLNLPEYMGVVMFTVFTLGAGIFIYNSLSAETNAAKDDYKRRVEAHFDVMNARLRDITEKLPRSEQKSLLQEFARRADYSLRMEKAVLAATASDTFNQGLKLVGSAEILMSDKAGPSYADAYLARTFPKAGYFESKLKDDLAQLKMQFL